MRQGNHLIVKMQYTEMLKKLCLNTLIVKRVVNRYIINMIQKPLTHLGHYDILFSRTYCS